MWASLKYWFQIVYAGAIAFGHRLVLDGPLLLGWSGFALKFIAAGLGTVAGPPLFEHALHRLGGKLGPWFLVILFAALSATAFIAHAAYFDGSQAEFSGLERSGYLASLFVVAMLMRAFLAAAWKVADIQRATNEK